MSTNVTIFLMFIALEVSIIIAFLILAREINLLERQMDAMRKFFSDSFEKLAEAYEGLSKLDESRQNVYRKIVEVDNKMDENLKKGFEIDKKIIDTWKGVQDSYSDAYEEYRHCIDKLETLDKAYADIYTKLQEIEENTKPIELDTGFELEDTEWDPFEFDDDDFWEEEDEQESDKT